MTRQLIVQADDMAISHGTSLGILDVVDARGVTAVGLFTNTADASFAAQELRGRRNVDIGLDLNFVTGSPLLPAGEVPALVDERGRFRTSRAIKAAYAATRVDGPFWEFETEPFAEEEVRREAQAQLERFLTLMGRPPAYLHHHSLVTPVTDRVLRGLADDHGIVAMDDLYRSGEVRLLANGWYASPFDVAAQAEAAPTDFIDSLIDEILQADHAVNLLIVHPGYVDADLLQSSSYSVVRPRDLQLVLDADWRRALTDAEVEVVTYREAGLL